MTPLTKLWVGDIVTIHAGGEAIEGTGNHPFWVVAGAQLRSRPKVGDLPNIYERGIEGRWVEARHIRVGDMLLLRSGESISVASLSARQAVTKVYNLHVADWHTYTVGTQRILVHNYSGLPGAGCHSSGRTKTTNSTHKPRRQREVAVDPKAPRHVRGWLKQEQRRVKNAGRGTIRNPPGYILAHGRGRETGKGFSHSESPSMMPLKELHDLQHKHDNFGRENKRRD